MQDSLHLLRTRRFLPIFTTQFLGAFNDNLFRTSMVLLVIYGIYRDAEQEAAFSAIAGGLFILPFFLLSALSGQLADAIDKAKIVRIVKSVEIAIMIFGAAGLLLHNVPLMLVALTAMGIHSTFFGPIKYAILPQHMHKDEVLGATGLVEAGTYIAILCGTIFGGLLVLQRPDGSYHAEWAAVGVLAVALIGRIAGGFVPPPRRPTIPRSRATRIAGWTGTSSALRLRWSVRRCTFAAFSSPFSRSASSGPWEPSSRRNSRRW